MPLSVAGSRAEDKGTLIDPNDVVMMTPGVHDNVTTAVVPEAGEVMMI